MVNFAWKMHRTMSGIFKQWLPILVFMLVVVGIESVNVDITYLESAVANGAGKEYETEIWRPIVEAFSCLIYKFIQLLVNLMVVICSLFGWKSTCISF